MSTVEPLKSGSLTDAIVQLQHVVDDLRERVATLELRYAPPPHPDVPPDWVKP